jgi:hypothetical protein
MNILRTVLRCIVPCLMLLLTACAAAKPQITPGIPAGDPRPPLPQPLKVLTAERLSAKPDSRYPPADFGKAIALGDGVLAVGAPSITSGPEYSDSGSVYIYRQGADGWAEEAQLRASDRGDGFQYAQAFGSALALNGDLLFVGAPTADDRQAGDNTGAVYIFEDGPNGWDEIAILKSPQPAANNQFGNDITAHGEHLGVVEGNYSAGGRLRLFQGQGGDWRQTAVIEAPAPDGGHGGISAFDLYANTLAVGTVSFQGEEADTHISGEVRLYWFDGATWVTTGNLPSEIFGTSIALDGQGTNVKRLAVGSPWYSTSGLLAGSVAIFTRNGESWELEETLGSPDMELSVYWGGGYGGSVALGEDLLLTGGPGYSEDSLWDGAAYLYQLSDGRWIDQLRLTPPEDGGSGDFFGSEVEIYSNTLLVSAPNEFGNAVYVYEVGVK